MNSEPVETSTDVRVSESQGRVRDQLILGKTNEEIAETLGLSIKNIKAHLTGLYKATGCKNARQFIVKHYNPEGTK